MRDIAHGFFEQSPAMAGPLVALVLFFLVFAAIAYRVLRSRPSDWKDDAALPLSDSPGVVRGADATQLCRPGEPGTPTEIKPKTHRVDGEQS